MGFFNGKGKPENGFTVEDLYEDAASKLAILRAMAAEFMEEGDPQPLTAVEQREAARVPAEYLERAAAVSEAAPRLPGMPPDAVPVLRLGRDAAVCYLPVAEEAERLARQVRTTLVRKKVRGAGIARFIDRLARALVESGVAEWLRPHVEELKRILTRPPHTERQFPFSKKNLSRDVTSRHES